ncbi:parallel beta helix pectate lyase-like protein [Cellulophaga sp. RHA_52]|uniref:right-handed parallel beta-helix repeat-containing protein n=1 Tax=Cellulophaga sp. RHA_52 TaxID=1250036 RepID=UPI00119B633E|nr:right-handed parallel beta-helix repeat-containing protein [Cellulophaga sp. RHA_52]TVZ10243.1 parallel beta helix pectate lyase-like protein [Cellulophaga sp. RHA_52]
MHKQPLTLVKVLVFSLFIATTLVSCSQEDLLANVIAENAAEEEPDTEPDVQPIGDLDINTTPCDYTLDGIAAGTTLAIECQLDLDGKTVSLPTGVTLEYKGGEIINGTLNFTAGGKIDGNLLNQNLTVEGNVSLISETFEFHPSRWDIVQGKVNDEVAILNTTNFKILVNKINELGGFEFKVDVFDAYFKTDGYLNISVPELHAINLPSNFHLAMSENTHLRMQPHGHFRAALLSIYDAENIKVSGGYLHGERDEHNYNSGFVDSDGATGKTNEWVNVMSIKGGREVTIDGVTFMDAAGDCLAISSIYHYNDSRHIRSKDITLRDNKFIRARRTNLVIVNGEYIYVENNEFIDGGIDTENSTGTAPSSNFNMEPVRGRDAVTGALIEYERVSHVYFRGNKQVITDVEANPRAGGFFFSHGNGPIIVEDNEIIDCGISFHTVEGLVIRNNTITGGSISAGSAQNFNRTDFVYGNEVYGNTIKTEGVAINIAGNGTIVYENDVEATVGIALGAGAKTSSNGVSNTKIYNNSIKAYSRGITSMNTMENVTIEDNTLEMQEGANFSLAIGNKWEMDTDSNFIIKNNTITGVKTDSETGAPPSLIVGNSIEIIDNKFGDVQLNTGASNVILRNNEIDANIGASGILFYDDSPNSIFSGNKIYLYVTKTPLKIEPIKVYKDVKLSGNVVLENNTVIEM